MASTMQTQISQLKLTVICFLLCSNSLNPNNVVFGKKISTFSGHIPTMIEVNTGGRQELVPYNGNMLQSSAIEATLPSIRASSFMVDPLIIIALIALPTIGMLGLSSLIMPLIPIGIYLIQQFFPTNAGRRRRRRSMESNPMWEHQIELFADKLQRMLSSFA